ncbi:HNH endonuclease [Archangium gephyra]|uniref:HNH endonuclease n=1 Tax=Archangium gephyra TaxID=48 RepID=A0ABX9K2N8_9BACT|nr:HNH endonuclease [Archangium gephyra]REG32172.1 HNH endonuclease [Archangium gephyra]
MKRVTASASEPKNLLNEYEAAVLVGMSPSLLRWLTTYAPKHGIERKLKIAKQENELLFFDRAELTDFDNWLKLPWPVPPKASRPNIPSKIREEITIEAGGVCAICHGHADSCEAAHLDPVHKSKNNHPENLLWLCSDHHTVYDKGLFGPTEANKDFVASFKISLAFHKKQIWRMQGAVSDTLYSILTQCAALEEQFKTATTAEQVQAVSKLANDTVKLIPRIAPVSEKDRNYKAFVSIKPHLAKLTEKAKSEADITTTLQLAREVRTEFVAAAGYVPCPLCEGLGTHNGNDCPVCNGDREVEKQYAERAELRQYENVSCPLCDGDKYFHGEHCPACGGEGSMERRFAEEVNVRDYSEVECLLCKGTRHFDRDTCCACGGAGTMPRHQADALDLRQYAHVPCPLCDGEGTYDSESCLECGGEGQMQRRYAEQVDLSKYDIVVCPLCKGSCQHEGEDCPECNAKGRLPRHQADRVDLWQYKHVTCPACRGKRSQHCDSCDGAGTMPRWRAERME